MHSVCFTVKYSISASGFEGLAVARCPVGTLKAFSVSLHRTRCAFAYPSIPDWMQHFCLPGLQCNLQPFRAKEYYSCYCTFMYECNLYTAGRRSQSHHPVLLNSRQIFTPRNKCQLLAGLHSLALWLRQDVLFFPCREASLLLLGSSKLHV